MGRGRAKAKQTKLARELKYQTVSTDLSALERELRGSEGEVPEQYADLAAEYDYDEYDVEELDDETEDDEDDERTERR